MELIWAVLGLSRAPVGQSRGCLLTLLGRLGALLGRLGAPLGRLGALLAVWGVSWYRRLSWAFEGPSQAVLVPPEALLG